MLRIVFPLAIWLLSFALVTPDPTFPEISLPHGTDFSKKLAHARQAVLRKDAFSVWEDCPE
ncbi:MAG: hypothetical protein GX986_03115 [Firmicutes bacterium]|nr:hypothetical protein [Bacillota bacterium]